MTFHNASYFVEDRLALPRKHHESFEALWETKWRDLCSRGVYPFMYARIQDFEPVVEDLVRANLKEPYDWDEYAAPFFPRAEALLKKAEDYRAMGDKHSAGELYLRASALYRIARFPIPRSEKQQEAWRRGKDACLMGHSCYKYPIRQIDVPHLYSRSGEGNSIPVYYLTPAKFSAEEPVPLVIIITGLDGYRTELSVWQEGWRRLGCASLVVEIPGTGDSPADASDPKSPDRQWTSLLFWVQRQLAIDPNKVIVWSFSTGGFYGIRFAHTHAKQLKGVVANGAAVHHFLDSKWLRHADHLEYPFDLAGALCYKFGYGNDVAKFKKEAQDKFSLVRDGTLYSTDCARLLLVNGMDDEIFPIDDYIVALQFGTPKEARLLSDRPHMGEPESFVIILNWIYDLLGIKANPFEQLSGIATSERYFALLRSQ